MAQAPSIVDRSARDWLIMLIESALAEKLDQCDLDTLNTSPFRTSPDPVVEDATEALMGFINGRHQLNASGTYPVIVNPEDERRRMLVLLTFLRSDIAYKNSRRITLDQIMAYAFFAFVVLVLIYYYPPWSGLIKQIVHGIYLVGTCSITLLIFLMLGAFIWHRWIDPPKPNTDENDHWPFASYEALLAERQRQQAQQSPDPDVQLP